MKRFIFPGLVVFCGIAMAQPAAPAPKPAPRVPTEITSDSADFDLNSRQAVYRGHVFVNDPEVQMHCELLTVNFPSEGGHLSRVQAETNVVIDFIDQKGQTNHLTAGQAVYAYSVDNLVTNETVTFTINPVVETPEARISAEPMIWDRAIGHLKFTNPHMISQQNLKNSGGTNAAGVKLF